MWASRPIGAFLIWLLAAAVCGSVEAAEIHTRGVAGTWSACGGAIPDNEGYSFFLLDRTVSLDKPVTITARIRFRRHVDYTAAGVALVDPSSTNARSTNIRLELSERGNTFGVGGWKDASEGDFGGRGGDVGRDIKVGEWYEVTLVVDGTSVTGLLDGANATTAAIPAIASVARRMNVAFFVIEADAEFELVSVSNGEETPAAAPLRSGTYQVETRVGDKDYQSTWTLEVSGNRITGTSEWNCCPGRRVDPLTGRIDGAQVVIERDCRGQGSGDDCRQTYEGTIANGFITGTFSGTGAWQDANWKLHLGTAAEDADAEGYRQVDPLTQQRPPLPITEFEVHTSGTAGTWTPGGTTESLLSRSGFIPNDNGWSFHIFPRYVDLNKPVAVTARVRFKRRVDFGGAGIAIIDPNSSSRYRQPHVRVELSERENTLGIGGWYTNHESPMNGGGGAVGRDVKVGEWHELTLRIDGSRVSGSVDGKEYAADIPTVNGLSREMSIAFFVIEADAEFELVSAPGSRVFETRMDGGPGRLTPLERRTDGSTTGDGATDASLTSSRTIPPSGGRVSAGGATVEIPAGALPNPGIVSVTPVAAPARTINPGQTIVSQGFAVSLPRPYLAKPATITLPFDKSRLPAGTNADDIRPLLVAEDGSYERLERVAVDMEAGEVTARFDHAVPVIYFLEGGLAPRKGALTVAVESLIFVETGPYYVAYVTGSEYARHISTAREVLDKARGALASFDNPPPFNLIICDISKPGAAGFASNNTIELDAADIEQTPAALPTYLIHEYFHLVQQHARKMNLMLARYSGDVFEAHMGRDAEWFREASADYIADVINANDAMTRLRFGSLSPQFGYQPLTTIEEITGGGALPHQYSSAIFLHYLNEYGNGPEIVREFWRLYLAEEDDYDELKVLDKAIQTVARRHGREAPSLENIYVRFLLQYYYLKKFEPYSKIHDRSLMGGERIIRFHKPLHTEEFLPLRGLQTSVATIYFPETEGFRIIQSGYLFNGDMSREGDLDVRVVMDNPGPSDNRYLAVVFPRPKDGPDLGPHLEPLFSNSRGPLTIPDWKNYRDALFWIVSVDHDGFRSGHLEFRIRERDTGDVDAAVTIKVVSSADGRPIPGAAVNISGYGGVAFERTDAEGRATFRVWPGEYYGEVALYSTTSGGYLTTGYNVAVPPEGIEEVVRLVKTPDVYDDDYYNKHGQVALMILSEDGVPVPQALLAAPGGGWSKTVEGGSITFTALARLTPYVIHARGFASYAFEVAVVADQTTPVTAMLSPLWPMDELVQLSPGRPPGEVRDCGNAPAVGTILNGAGMISNALKLSIPIWIRIDTGTQRVCGVIEQTATSKYLGGLTGEFQPTKDGGVLTGRVALAAHKEWEGLPNGTLYDRGTFRLTLTNGKLEGEFKFTALGRCVFAGTAR